MSTLKNTTITYKARFYVYEGGGIKGLPDEVIDELAKRRFMIGQAVDPFGEEETVSISIRHVDHGARFFLDSGDAIMFIDDESVQDHESVKVEWARA